MVRSSDVPVEGARPPQLPDYELLSLVGRGSYGEVWLARGITGVFRAIKIIWRHRFEDADPFEREFRGVRLFAGLSIQEPRLLAVFHVGRNDEAGFFYYVMEPADDATAGAEIDPANYSPRTLSAPRDGTPAATTDETIRLGVDLAEALAVLHTAGLVHRDIKPANVIQVAGLPKLADVGLIAELGAQTFVGTEGYVAPEGPGSPAGDVFSLGKVLYEVATGLDRREFPRLPDLGTRPDAERLLELMSVLNRACARDPQARHVDALALLADLRLLVAGKSVRRLRAAERRLRGLFRVAAVLSVVAALGWLGAWIERHRAAAADTQRRWAVYAGILSRAEHAAEGGDLPGARTLLRQAGATSPPSPANLEWQLASRPVLPSAPRRVLTTNSPAHLLRVTPDGHRIVGLGRKQELELVSEPPGFRRTLPEVRQFIAFADTSPALWLLRTNGNLGYWTPDTDHFESVLHTDLGIAGASNDGRILCVTNTYSRCHLQVWRLADAPTPPTTLLDLPPDPTIPDVWGTALSGNGEILAFGRFSEGRPGNRFEIWNVRERRRTVNLETEGDIWALDVSPDGSWVAAGFESGEIILVNVAQGRVSHRVRGGTGRPLDLTFAPDNRRLLVIGEGGMLVTFEVDPKPEPRLLGSADGLRAADWFGPRNEIVTSDATGRLVAWSLEREPDHRQFVTTAGFALKSFAMTADGQTLAVTAGTDAIDIVDARTAQVARRLQGGFRPIGFTQAGHLAACDADSRVRLWDVASGELLWSSEVPAPEISVSQTVGAGDGRHVALGTVEGELLIWNVAERRLLQREKPGSDPVTAITGGLVTPGIAAGTYGGSCWFWRPDDPRIRSITVATNYPVTALALSPDGSRLAVVQAGVGFRVFDAARNLALTPPVPLADRRVFAALWTTDGQRVILGGSGGVLEFRETGGWAEVATLHLPNASRSANPRPMQLWMNPSADHFAAFLANGTVLWWDQLKALPAP